MSEDDPGNDNGSDAKGYSDDDDEDSVSGAEGSHDRAKKSAGPKARKCATPHLSSSSKASASAKKRRGSKPKNGRCAVGGSNFLRNRMRCLRHNLLHDGHRGTILAP